MLLHDHVGGIRRWHIFTFGVLDGVLLTRWPAFNLEQQTLLL